MLTISIDRQLETPVYEQVAHQVRELITAGALEPGTALPSVRRLAQDLGVNLNTVARAYRLLEGQGFLTIKDRAGVTVAAPADHVEASSLDLLLVELRATLARLRQAGLEVGELLTIVQHEVLALEGLGKGASR